MAVNPERRFFPFHSFLAYTGQLQKMQGYLQISLDLRIPTVPIFPVFRIRFGRKSGKTVEKRFFRFAVLKAQPGHLQKWQGYPWIELDLRIQMVPINLVFQSPFGQKTGKTSFPVLLYCDSTKAPTDLGRVPTDGS